MRFVPLTIQANQQKRSKKIHSSRKLHENTEIWNKKRCPSKALFRSSSYSMHHQKYSSSVIKSKPTEQNFTSTEETDFDSNALMTPIEYEIPTPTISTHPASFEPIKLENRNKIMPLEVKLCFCT